MLGQPNDIRKFFFQNYRKINPNLSTWGSSYHLGVKWNRKFFLALIVLGAILRHSIFLKHESQLAALLACVHYECVSKSFRTESVTKYSFTFGTTRWVATQKVMAAKLIRLTHKITIQLDLAAQSCIICSFRSRRPVRQLLDTISSFRFFFS